MSVPAIALGGVGATETISATIRDASGRVLVSPSVTWTSENPTVADVTGSGVSAAIVARAPGVTRIRAASGNAAAFMDVRVLGVRAIVVSPASLGLRVGDLAPLTAAVQGDAGASQAVRWSVLNPSVATVDASGFVTGVSVGTTTVRASAAADPSVLATATIVVSPARTISFAPGLSAITLWVGDTRTVPPEIDVDSTQSRALAWTTDNPAVATVSSDGTITAVSAGTCIIRVASVADPRAKADLLVTVLPARRVTVTPANLTVGVQQQATLVASVAIDNGLSTAVTWASSNSAIASVSSSGTVIGIAQGVATITATSVGDPTRNGVATVSVIPTVRSVVVTPNTLSTFVADQDQLTADVIVDGAVARSTTWRTSNPAIATVSSAGIVASLAPGQATITAISTVDTTKRGSAVVTVQPAPAVGISPSQANIAIGEQRALNGHVTVAQGLSTALIWRSSAPMIASVNASGVVTGQSIGSAIITMLAVADTTKQATATITVNPVVRSVDVMPASVNGFVGEVVQLTSNVVADGTLSRSTTWRTSNASVATVSPTGAVSLVSTGQATITAVAVADTTKRASANVSVGTPVVRGVSLSPPSASLFLGQTQQLNVTVSADGALSTAFTLRSSNPAVASVSATGLVTALTAGTSTITAIASADTTKRATATITSASRPISVTLSPRPVTVRAGATQQLSAAVSGDPGVSTAVTWNSAAVGIATVSSAGLVTGVANGIAVISATSVADPTKRDTVSVTVSTLQLATSWTSSRLGGVLYEDVVSTVGFGQNSAFVVNLLGDVYRWDGIAWTLSARGSTYGRQFLAVHGSTASNVFAVGTGGLIARFDGSTWSQMTSGTGSTLLDVWSDGAGSAMAVGANGTALRLSGATWVPTSTGSVQTLNGVWTTAGATFAVGAAGEVLRFNGSSWSRQSVPTAETLYGVSGTSTSNVVVVGSVGTILRFDGTSWTVLNNSVSSSDLYSVDGTTANGGRMHIASDAGLLQLDGTTLSRSTTPYRPRLYAVSADAAGMVWAVGQRGIVMRQVSGTWNTVNLAPDLLDAWSTSPTNAWAVGEFGSIYRWSGANWMRESVPTVVTLNSVWGASASEAFAGGEAGTMLRFNGSSWSVMSFPSTANISAIWGSSGSDVYATTSAGQVARFNGAFWSIVATTTSPLWGVFGLSSSEVYVSGENGTLLRFNGSGWTPNSPTNVGTLAGLWGSSSSNLLTVGADAAGANGVAFRFSGSGWSPQAMGTSRVLTSTWGASPTDLYAAGDQGTIVRFNGTAWQPMSTGTVDLLWAITGSPTGSGAAFAVGYNSTLVSGTGTGPYTASARTFARANRAGSLDPAPSAERSSSPQALPDGSARRRRGSSARTLDLPPSIKFRAGQRR